MKAEEYKAIIQKFVDEKTSAADFEREFLEAYLNEPAGMNTDLYNILQELFWSVEAYWSECTPEEEDEETITADTMRRNADKSLARLDYYLQMSHELSVH